VHFEVYPGRRGNGDEPDLAVGGGEGIDERDVEIRLDL